MRLFIEATLFGSLLLTASPASSAQDPAPAARELHTELETASQTSSLIRAASPAILTLGPHAQPFHLTAQIDIFDADGKTVASQAQLDQLWQDRLHWKLTVTYLGDIFTEVNGTQSFTSGRRHLARRYRWQGDWL